MLHTMPFKLVKDKIVVQARVNGGRLQDFMLDTGSEETVLSRETAQRERIRADHLHAQRGRRRSGAARPAAGAA